MRALFLIIVVGLFLAACGKSYGTYTGPKVTRVVVEKAERKMYLLHGPIVLREYDVGLGFAPIGDKVQEGDGRTPEGVYEIDRRNPQSQFYLNHTGFIGEF